MIKFKQIGAIKVSKINPVLTSEEDVKNYSFLKTDDATYLILNTITGDNSYMEDIVIKAGDFLNGYRLDALSGHVIVVDKKHIKDNYEMLDADMILKIGEDGLLELVDEVPEGEVYFVITDRTNLTEPAVSARVYTASGAKYEPAPAMTVEPTKMDAANVPQDANAEKCKANQEKITVSKTGHDVEVSGKLEELQEYPSSNPVQGTHKWVSVIVDTGEEDITKVCVNDVRLTEADVAEANSVKAPAGSFVLWLKTDEIVNNPRVLRIRADGKAPFAMSFSFKESE